MSAEQANSLRTETTVPAFKKALEDNLNHTRGQAVQSASLHDAYVALAYTVRDHLIDRPAADISEQISMAG